MTRKMKDSGIEWIGMIPEGWDRIRLRYLCTIETGNMDTQDADSEGIYPFYVRSPNIEKSSKYTFQGEGIIVAGDGVGAGRVFHHAFGEYGVHQRCYRLSNFNGINPDFLFYYISNMFPNIMDYGSAQSTVPSIRLFMLQDFPVYIPLRTTQPRIVAYLDAKCAEIDALIAAKEKSNALLKEYRQSIIFEAVTKGLDPNAPMKDSGIEWIGMIPEGWNVVRTKYVAEITNGTDPKTDGDIPVYGSGGGSFKTCGEFKQGPAVLLGRKGTVDIPQYITGDYWNVDTAFDVKTNQTFNLKYFYYLSKCFDYRYYISTTTLPSMTQTNYGNIVLPSPDINEQTRIADYLDAKCAEIDALIEANEKTIRQLKEYRQSVIFGAVTGKMEV